MVFFHNLFSHLATSRKIYILNFSYKYAENIAVSRNRLTNICCQLHSKHECFREGFLMLIKMIYLLATAFKEQNNKNSCTHMDNVPTCQHAALW
jgi:hypothetical protein